MTRRAGTEDFASATMMRLVAAGLARQGIALNAPRPSGARVPRRTKREALEAVLARHGRIAILRIADAARHMPPEPVAQALTNACDVADLFARWRRLERFAHARHEVMAEPLGGGAFRLGHRARDGGPPPSEAETLVVMALLAVLVEMIASGPVDLRGEDGAVWRSSETWRDPGPRGAWIRTILRAPTARRTPVSRSAGPADDLVVDLRRRLCSDPVRRWTLSDLAAEVGTSRRTLQRRLEARSLSFSGLVAEARLQKAAEHLCNSAGPCLAEVGFLSGYSDQAHFTRCFSAAVGTSPGAYRADFSRQADEGA